MNHVTGQLYFTYAEIIAAKTLSGKTPKIIEAYRFEPVGVQNDLKKINLFGREVDPSKESFVKVLIEHRLDIKKRLDADKDNVDLDNQQHILKIIANSIYGINVQIDTVPVDKSKYPDGKVIKDVYALRHLHVEVKKNEEQGRAFNPLIATWLTSGARLILAMAEAYVDKIGGYYAYMDTDGIFVDPDSVKGLQELVQGLNPYSRPIDMFKIEEADDKTLLDNVTFFGISAKRYCLYTKDNVTGTIKILKCSSSAIGHICSMPRGWEKDFWVDIIRYDKGEINDQYLEDKYGKIPVAAQISISSPTIRNQFMKYYNVTAFNFMIMGVGYKPNPVTEEPIIPMIPFTKDVSPIIYTPFVDKITGKLYTDNTQFYWKPLSKLFKYINHEETKYEGNIGMLKRRHLRVDNAVNNVIYIGKESNNLEESEVIGVQEDDNVIYDDKIMDKTAIKQDKTSVKNQNIIRIIIQMTPKQASLARISKRQVIRWRKKLRNHEPIMLRKKTVRKLLNML